MLRTLTFLHLILSTKTAKNGLFLDELNRFAVVLVFSWFMAFPCWWAVWCASFSFIDLPISDKLHTAEPPCGGSNKIHPLIQGVYRYGYVKRDDGSGNAAAFIRDKYAKSLSESSGRSGLILRTLAGQNQLWASAWLSAWSAGWSKKELGNSKQYLRVLAVFLQQNP